MLLAEPVSISYLTRNQISSAKARKRATDRKHRSSTYAYTAGATAYSQADKQHRGKERVLRYPDGRVRCIRYPMIAAEAERLAEQLDPTVSYEEDWDPDRWDDIDWAWDVLSSHETASTGAADAALVRPLPKKAESPQKAKFCHKKLACSFVNHYFEYANFCFTCCRLDIPSPVLQTCYVR